MILPLYVLLLVPLVNAWTFRYTNATGATEIARGNEAQNCTDSPIGKQKLFSWDPEGSDLCVSIYRTPSVIPGRDTRAVHGGRMPVKPLRLLMSCLNGRLMPNIRLLHSL